MNAAVPVCGLDGLHRLAVIDGQRLLAEYVLAGLGRLDGPFRVPRVGGGDVDGLNVVVGEQILVAPVGSGRAVLPGERLGLVFRAAARGQQETCAAGRQPLGEFGGDSAAAYDAPVQFVGHGIPASKSQERAICSHSSRG
jgi:hypothetical protein